MTPDADRRLAVAALAVIVGALAFAVGYEVGQPAIPSAGSVDVGFLRDMIDHHDQAVVMSTYVTRPGSGVVADTGSYATEILIEQRYEIGVMTAWLNDWGYEVGDPERRAMAWMDSMEPTSVADMPGMQTQAAVDRLEAARGTDADRAFLEMMIEHHQGGIHMAEYASDHAEDVKVRDLATRIISVQRGEITDLRNLQKRLGLPVT